MAKYKTEQERIRYIKEFSRGATPTVVRKEIGKVWGLKKTARNDKFRKLFEKSPIQVVEPQKWGVAGEKLKGGDLVCNGEDGKIYKCLGGKKVASPQVNIKGDKATVEVKGASDIATLDQLVSYCKIDLSVWEPKNFTSSVYKGGLSLRAEFKRKISNDLAQIIEELKEDALDYSPNIDKIKYKAVQDGKLLVIGIMDAHIGRLSNSLEVGHNYDIKIAREIYLKTLHDLVEKAKKQGDIEKILYVIGNDYLTVDGDSLQTTAGTDQDTDGRFPKIFREGRKLLVETIDILTQIAPVDVVTVYGNHERASMFHIGDALQCWFHNNENVKIDNNERLRKYYKWKDIVIATTHGDTIKHEKLVTMGLVEFGPEWGAAKRRFWLLGHTHHLKCVNLQGTELWTFPSICGSDGFHQANGYVGSTRNGLAMIFSKDNLEAVFQSQPVEDKDYQ